MHKQVQAHKVPVACLIQLPSISLLGILMLFSGFAYAQKLSFIPNPVLPNVADAGVIKFNGEYYIGGVFTKGSLYRSADLVKWSEPVHVFSMNNDWATKYGVGDEQIHACDINYINGQFHLYWSVNYWGREKNIVHIGHAVSPNVLGPYTEPVKETWLDNRIDPKLFVDDDGKAYMYEVRFTDGNTIWARPMKDPQTFSGEPVYLFASLPNTWETLDNRVEEGPWVMKYRNRYYLIFNANHTSPSWGNYALGVAEAGSPLGFNNGTKYPYPLLQSNQPALEDSCVDLLRYAPDGAGIFYTLQDPGDGWNKEDFDASAWQKERPGFGSSPIKGSTTRSVRTPWKTPEIWARKTFVLEQKDIKRLMLRIHHDGNTRVFLNGQPVYESEGRKYATWNLDAKALSLLKEGKNLLAVSSRAGRQSNFLDVSLFDMKGTQGDDILFSPGQPNILRGPNGFEWWLIYMANKNSDTRGQYINRIHFFNKTMFAEGVTSSNTPGYHPPPARAGFSDLFNRDEETIANKWNGVREGWKPANGELLQTGKAPARLVIKSQPASHYLFEASVKLPVAGTAKAGIIAWWKDEANWLKILLDRNSRSWLYELRQDGKTRSAQFALPARFNFDVYHKITVFKNASLFTTAIDDLPAPAMPVIRTAVSGKGLPGLYAQGANSAFDGVLYTIGWDEFDSTITGWGAAPAQLKNKTTWSVSGDGLFQSDSAGIHAVFKGDTLREYEMSVQVKTTGNKGQAGIYAVYADAANYLKAVVDFDKQQFLVSGKLHGRDIQGAAVPLENMQSYYADMRYTDFIEKHFSLAAPVYVNKIRFSNTPAGADTLMQDLYKKADIFYRDGQSWHPLAGNQETPSSHPGFATISFPPVKMEELKFVNKQAEDRGSYLYKIGVNELCKTSLNLRVVKLQEAVLFFVDGKEILRLPNRFPASQVGLVTENAQAGFNGITLFHLPPAAAN